MELDGELVFVAGKSADESDEKCDDCLGVCRDAFGVKDPDNKGDDSSDNEEEDGDVEGVTGSVILDLPEPFQAI
jgi:hypothetical protein